MTSYLKRAVIKRTNQVARCLTTNHIRQRARIFQPQVEQKFQSRHLMTAFAQGKGSLYTLETTEAERITDLLQFHKLRKWGFVIYRCTYGDDDAWKRFMDHFNRRKDSVLIDLYDSPELADSIDWNVQEDLSLDRATKDEVRHRFKRWVASDARNEFPQDIEEGHLQCLLFENPRYNYCIHVDAEALHSVLSSPSPTDPSKEVNGYINLIRADDSWEHPDFDRFDWANRKVEGEEDPYDEREPEVEGSRLYDVGWMKVGIDGLVPEFYERLTQNYMWDVHYHRPPHEILRF